MDKAVIKLPLGEYRAPTQQELNDGKAYVKRRNEVGAFRIASVELDITADVDRNFLKEFEHCAKIVKSCTIAGSLMDGMDVVHHIRTA